MSLPDPSTCELGTIIDEIDKGEFVLTQEGWKPVEVDERPNWWQHFMEIAHVAAKMSTCKSGKKIGAVAVDSDKQILATGFNGVPSGFPHPKVCMRRILGHKSGVGKFSGDSNKDPCVCNHAEQGLLTQAAIIGISLKGATIFTTTQPCSTCARLLANVKIKQVVYETPYPDPVTAQIFRHAGIEMNTLGALYR